MRRPRFSATKRLPFESTAMPCAWTNSPGNTPGRPKVDNRLPVARSKISICDLFCAPYRESMLSA